MDQSSEKNTTDETPPKGTKTPTDAEGMLEELHEREAEVELREEVEPPTEPTVVELHGRGRRIPPEVIEQIRQAKREGKTYTQIQETFGVSRQSIADHTRDIPPVTRPRREDHLGRPPASAEALERKAEAVYFKEKGQRIAEKALESEREHDECGDVADQYAEEAYLLGLSKPNFLEHCCMFYLKYAEEVDQFEGILAERTRERNEAHEVIERLLPLAMEGLTLVEAERTKQLQILFDDSRSTLLEQLFDKLITRTLSEGGSGDINHVRPQTNGKTEIRAD